MAIDIRVTLRDRGLKQKDVADRLAVSAATVSEWGRALREGNHQRVPAEKAKQLADLLGVTPSMVRPDLWQAEAA